MTGPGPDHDLEALLDHPETHEPGSVDWDPITTRPDGTPPPPTDAPRVTAHPPDTTPDTSTPPA